MTDRAEHLQWCKDRALEIVKTGDLPGAWASFVSDMNKEPSTSTHSALAMGGIMLMAGQLGTEREMEKFINDFG